MEELYSKWLTPEYAAMIAVIAFTLKILFVPIVKGFIPETHYKGYTPVLIAFIGAVILSFLFKVSMGVGAWDVKDIVMTLFVAVFSATSAIGLNVTTQAMQGKNVSINDG